MELQEKLALIEEVLDVEEGGNRACGCRRMGFHSCAFFNSNA